MLITISVGPPDPGVAESAAAGLYRLPVYQSPHPHGTGPLQVITFYISIERVTLLYMPSKVIRNIITIPCNYCIIAIYFIAIRPIIQL